MKRQPDYHSAVEQCLEKIARGGSMDEALEQFPPQEALKIRPLIQAALQAQRLAHRGEIPAQAQLRSRQQFLQAAQRLQNQPPNISVWKVLRPAFVFLSVLALVLVGVLGTGAASADALPGQPLYPYKLWTEKTRLLLSNKPAERLRLADQFDQERVQEVEALFAHEDEEEVTFAGFLSQDGTQTWRVAGIPLEIPAGVSFGEEFTTGVYVEVHGVLVYGGIVHVESITLRHITFTGRVERINGELWKVAGLSLRVMPVTEMKSLPKLGDIVRVEALRRQDGGLVAIRMEILRTGKPPADSTYPAPTAESWDSHLR